MMALFQHKHPPGMGFHYKDNTVVVSETVLFLKVKASRGCLISHNMAFICINGAFYLSISALSLNSRNYIQLYPLIWLNVQMLYCCMVPAILAKKNASHTESENALDLHHWWSKLVQGSLVKITHDKSFELQIFIHILIAVFNWNIQ